MAQNPEAAVPQELTQLLKYLPEAEDEERGRFFAAADAFLRDTAPDVLARFPPLSRIKWQLARERRIDELVSVIRFERENPSAFNLRGWRNPRAEVPGLVGAPLSDDTVRLRPSEIPIRTKLTSMTWHDGKLRLEGYAYLDNVPVGEKPRLPRFAWLSQKGSKRRIPLKMTPRLDVGATIDSGQALHRYDWSGFEITVDPDRLRSGSRWQTGQWSLVIGLLGPGGLHKGQIKKGEIGSAGHPLAQEVSDGVRLVCRFPKGSLELSVDETPVRVERHEFTQDTLRLDLLATSAPTGVRITHTVDGTESGRDYPVSAGEPFEGRIRCSASVPVADLRVAASAGDETRTLRTTVLFADGTTAQPVAGASLTPDVHPSPDGRETAVSIDGTGLFSLFDRVAQPVVDHTEWTADGDLVLAGRYSGPDREMDFILRHGQRFEEVRLPLERDGDRFRVRVSPERVERYGAELPLSRGRWYFSFRLSDAWGHEDDAPVKLRGDLLTGLPSSNRGKGRTFTLSRRFHDRIFLLSGNPLTDEERGAYRQRSLREGHYPAQQALPLREAVLYNSFGGKQYSDSPRAIHEELVRRGVEVEHLWTVDDQQVAVPEGVTPVEWHSAAWYEALARSRYVVTNVGISDWFTRREGQVVVQTWHGTPLKKIGADLLGTPKANRAYIANLPHRSRQWDFLVSPNTFTTPIMKNAFRCETEILESGYPRNDVFHSPDRDKTAQRVRELLGIPAGKRVVLYAPTWRDDQRYARTRFKLDLQVDLAAAERELGDDHVFLFRKHPKVLDSIPGAGQGFVWDVSKYPDIADLYLIADVLITDYSSAFFDFAHSGKPMLFFTYDLEHYRDTLRGFYFDLTTRAPGPLIQTSEELVESIRDLDAVAERHRDRYAAFVRDFCDPSDGLATTRVVDRMLKGSG
ncbi:CDP-glycerol glycerophosphotransferase family protein [Actinorugispora endophytica]|uniref:CDP-glycerol glycerophosphotransferase n=1 Tax=Actinorugispora endophytica TaxID=1605990 RepID=A0A4R6UX65_9ACTN|nr:CDP-glycerol glycerophosphotransferase family protein [Actinorugispora endophytica]TDQ51990.1 CDP-glycerol glycerophosphotransferase [Actinorugispora endophytica]